MNDICASLQVIDSVQFSVCTELFLRKGAWVGGRAPFERDGAPCSVAVLNRRSACFLRITWRALHRAMGPSAQRKTRTNRDSVSTRRRSKFVLVQVGRQEVPTKLTQCKVSKSILGKTLPFFTWKKWSSTNVGNQEISFIRTLPIRGSYSDEDSFKQPYTVLFFGEVFNAT